MIFVRIAVVLTAQYYQEGAILGIPYIANLPRDQGLPLLPGICIACALGRSQAALCWDT